MANSNDFVVKNGLVVSTTATILSLTNTLNTYSGALIISGGVGIGQDLRVGGTIYSPNIYSPNIVGLITTATNLAGGLTGSIPFQTTPGETGFINIGAANYALVSNSTTATWQAVVNSLVAGTDTAVSSTSGSITIWNTSTLQSITQRDATTNQAISITNATASTSTTSGALIVSGGLGVGGYVYASRLHDDGNRVVTRVTPSGSTYIGVESIVSAGTATSFTIKNLGVTDLTGSTYLGISTSTGSISLTNLGVQTLTAGTDTAVSSSTGTVTVWNTSTLQSITQRGATTNQIISITNTTSAVSSTTGALQVVGGIGVQGDVFVGGKITAQQLTIEYTTITSVSTVIDDITTIKNATQTTSTNTGALQVWGGVGIGGGMFVDGTVTATNFVGNFSGVANTATNLAGGATNSIPYQANAGITSFIAIGSSGYFLQSNGPSVAPSWTALSGVTAGSATTATNLAGGTPGAIPYQSTTGTTTFIGIGNTGTLLQSNGTTATWANTATMSVGLAVTATNIANGQAGQLHYQTAPGVTAFISTGTIGNVAVSSGINGITYQNTLTLTGTTAATSTTTGALTVSGGVGVGGGLFVGNATTIKVAVSTAFTPVLYLQNDAGGNIGNGTGLLLSARGDIYKGGIAFEDTTSFGVGSLHILNNITGNATTATKADARITLNATGQVLIPGTIASTSTTTGALQVVGGVGVGGGIYVGNNSTFTGIVSITNTTASTSTNTGALQVTGGVGIGGGLNVGGTITGTVTTATNLAGGATNSLPYQTNAGITSFIAIGSIGYILQSNGPSVAPSWTALSGVTAGSATTATNLAGGTSGALPYQVTTGTTAFISIGSTGTILQSNSTTATWVSTSTLTVASAITATNIASGQAGQLHYQTAPGITGFISTGTIGNVAVSSGINGIAYQNTLTLTGTTVSASTTTGALTVAGGVGIGGALNVGGNILPGTTNQYDLGSPTNRFRTLYVSSATVDIGGVTLSNVSGVLTLPKTTINDTTTATSTNTGALTVTGGVGVGGSVYIGKALYGNSSTFTIGVTPDVSQGKAIVIASGDAPGSVTDAGDVTITAGAGASSSQAGSINLNAGSVSSGGAGSINLTAGNNALGSGGDIKLTPGIKGFSGNDGAVLINRYTAATSTTTGALQVYGGVGVGGSLYASNLYDSGNRVVTRVTPNGSTYIGIDTITSVGTATTFTVKNLGVQQNIGTTYIGVSTSTGSVYITNLGVQTLTAGTDTAVTNNTGTVTVWNTSTLQTVTGRGATTNNAISITNTTAVISTLTGALTVAGGVGIGGGIFVGGTVTATLFVGNLTGTATNATNATTATNLAGGATNSLPYQSNTGTTAFIAIGSSGYILQSNGAGSAPSWASVGALSAGQATTATNLAGGTPGAIPYQISTGTTAFIGIGANNTVLFSNGTTATWVSTASILGAVVTAPATPTTLGTVFGYTTGNGNTAIGCCAGNKTQVGCYNFVAGCNSLISNTSGCHNFAVGEEVLCQNTTGIGNVGFGRSALSYNTIGFHNFAAGEFSLYNNTCGTHNFAVGYWAMQCNISGCDNVAIGCMALTANLASNNLAIGRMALTANTIGAGNVALGYQNLTGNTTGCYNVAIGYYSLGGNKTGHRNIAIGQTALCCNTFGCDNTALGYQALAQNTTGSYNIAIGNGALIANTTGCSNVAIGHCTLRCNTTGYTNVAIGYGALRCNTTGRFNVAILGAACSVGGLDNIAIGLLSLNDNSGSGNIALGAATLLNNFANNGNIAIGCNAISNGAPGSGNVAIGALAGANICGVGCGIAIGTGAMRCSTSGCHNIAIGTCSLYCSSTGGNNLAIGSYALFSNSTGSNNMGIGCYSGCAITTGSYNVIIGSNTGSTVATSSCNIIISDGLGNARICATNTGSVLIPSTSTAISTQTGALQVTGGVGIGSDLYVGGTSYFGRNLTNYVSITAGGAGTSPSISFTTDAGGGYAVPANQSHLFYNGGYLSAAITGPGSGVQNYIKLTAAASGSSPILQTMAGLDTTVDLNVTTAGAGKVVVTNTVTSVSTNTGALTVAGGVGIGGSVWVGGELNIRGAATFQGNVTFAGSSTNIFSTNTVYTDNMLNLHVPSGSSGTNHTWTVDDGRDIGLLIHYYQGSDRDAGLVLNNSSKYLEWYSNGIENPANGTFTSTTYGIFKTGGIQLAGGTASTNTSTGDLQVLGGVGIGGALYVGGTITGTVTTATNLAGGTAGAIPYQSSAGVTNFIGIGTVNTVLTSNGSTATWTTTSTLTVASAVTATNLASGTAGAIPYQTAPGVTGFIGTGTTGYVLTMGATTATWQATTVATAVADTTTTATYYPVFTDRTTGIFSTATITSSKLTWNPGTGILTAVDVNTTSDLRQKTNIAEIADPLALLDQIKGWAFDYKDSGLSSYGVVAQELEKILPQLVGEHDTGFKTVRYLPLIAILIEAVKDLAQEVKTLKKYNK